MNPLATAGRLLLLAVLVSGCASPDEEIPADSAAPDSEFATVPDSAWIDVTGPTLIAFHPATNNELLEKDQDLASALDDLAYYVGIAMDSLHAQGYTVHYCNVDSVFLRSPTHRWRFAPSADSNRFGYVFTDTTQRVAAIYRVGGSVDLLAVAHEFRTTGQIRQP